MESQGEAALKAKIAQLEQELNQQRDELSLKNRELEIEAALEKVRVRTMSMTVSAQLSDTSAVLFQQLKHLRINVIHAGVGIFDDPNGAVELWTTFSGQHEEIKVLDYVNLHVHPVLENTIAARKENKPYSLTVLTSDEVREYHETISTFKLSEKQSPYAREFFYSFFFPAGMLNVTAYQSLIDEESNILTRFAHVFGLIYTRFHDLLISESNVKNASRQASLNRIRAEIASMRSRHDLEKITPLIWNELTILGIPFIRCGVFIMDETNRLVHTFLSTPDGKAIAAYHLPYDIPFTLISTGVEQWRNKQIYTEHWDAAAFANFWDYVTKMDDRYAELQHQAEQVPSRLHLHLIPFLQGMLYVGNVSPLDEDAIDLLKAVAEAFSTAYARYEDFNKLEMAKEQVEKTLADLKLTQDQLVHAEKMASLGELMAGIAHEIQNPMNFVNNFSEVSKELLAEMKMYMASGKKVEADELANSVVENLEKIHHHGKRADGIIKGMLQHSRNTSGLKEPTDINALAEEYLRLTYHGLRAKDKSFYVSYKTDFDNAVGSIEIIGQDLGRVVLNLLTNAFYAVTEKHRTKMEAVGGEKYEPMVCIRTKRNGSAVEIRIEDNGNGIPQKILGKIFQPFFTTKPTGQGTGLGLSLSYDIITKAHGGELRVETKEGEGTVFIVSLPG